MSQPGHETITIRKPNKNNQTMKFGQLIECNKKNIFLQNHAENLISKKSLLLIKVT